MKISEVIEKLEIAKKNFGDLEVVIPVKVGIFSSSDYLANAIKVVRRNWGEEIEVDGTLSEMGELRLRVSYEPPEEEEVL